MTYKTRRLVCCISLVPRLVVSSLLFFFNDTATTEIYTLSLHDALPISTSCGPAGPWRCTSRRASCGACPDRKSTRLNSSHANISYAVFCLKKKKDKKANDSSEKRYTCGTYRVR